MKINFNNERKTLTLKELPIGNCFLWESRFYMKVNMVDDPLSDKSTLVPIVDLDLGEVSYLKPNEDVIPLEAKVDLEIMNKFYF